MTNVAITGAAGRMGKTLVAAIAGHAGLTLTAAIEHEQSPAIGMDAGETAGVGRAGVAITGDLAAACEHFDLLIDFTVPAATEHNVAVCRAHGKHMVIGTTGLSESQKAAIAAAGQDIGIVFAPNYSVGVNATFKLAEVAATIMGGDVDIEIIESHHRNKIDAPSGTALGLGESIAGALGRDLNQVAVFGREGQTGVRDKATIGFHSIRAGDIVGEHTVVFAGAGERLEITHRAESRTNFAEGALRAAIWVMSRESGVFDMKDVLGL
ncbi:MAG TPA: 4-hydroxy-tetrahydrodipicolinate reductase [Pseudomonadales bacterium]|nr:4-hydroxy-tetrahydrodipicolinate reductase [Pseudomonadales bacterium]